MHELQRQVMWLHRFTNAQAAAPIAASLAYAPATPLTHKLLLLGLQKQSAHIHTAMEAGSQMWPCQKHTLYLRHIRYKPLLHERVFSCSAVVLQKCP
jgi:hypothetical protein